MILGFLFLLAFAGGLASLYSLRPGLVTISGQKQRLFRLKASAWLMAIIAWLISWALLNTVWKGKEYDLRKALIITLIFVALGVILTFPPVFEAFE